jgi:hypothetical protein
MHCPLSQLSQKQSPFDMNSGSKRIEWRLHSHRLEPPFTFDDYFITTFLTNPSFITMMFRPFLGWVIC